MAAQVEHARKVLTSAEQNRDANEKALAEARRHVRKTQQEDFALCPSGCPLDTDVCAVQGAVPAAAESNKDASGDVAMGEVDGVVIELPQDADQETKDLWQQRRELEKQMQQLQGEMGAQAAKRRKVYLVSPEAAGKAAADLQAAAAKAGEEVGGSQGL